MNDNNTLLKTNDIEKDWQKLSSNWIEEGKDNFYHRYVVTTKQTLDQFNDECSKFNEILIEAEQYCNSLKDN